MLKLFFTTARGALVLATMLILVATTASDARPRRVNGCTDAQIQSLAAGQCIDKMKDDIKNNRPTFHALSCSSLGTMRCCKYNQDGSTVDHSCELVSASRANPGIFSPNDLVGGGSLVRDDDDDDDEPPANPNPDGTLY